MTISFFLCFLLLLFKIRRFLKTVYIITIFFIPTVLVLEFLLLMTQTAPGNDPTYHGHGETIVLNINCDKIAPPPATLCFPCKLFKFCWNWCQPSLSGHLWMNHFFFFFFWNSSFRCPDSPYGFWHHWPGWSFWPSVLTQTRRSCQGDTKVIKS